MEPSWDQNRYKNNIMLKNTVLLLKKQFLKRKHHFWGSGAPFWDRKSIKNRSKNGIKIEVHFGIDFLSILARFWDHLGAQKGHLGPFCPQFGPFWPQLGSQDAPKDTHIHKKAPPPRFPVRACPFRWGQDGPRWGQDGQHGRSFGLFWRMKAKPQKR